MLLGIMRSGVVGRVVLIAATALAVPAGSCGPPVLVVANLFVTQSGS